MNKFILIIIFLVAFLVGPSFLVSLLPETSANNAPVTKPLNADQLWSLIQTWRQSDDCRPGGCQTYIKDQRLCEIAEARVKDGSDNHEGLYSKYSSYPYAIQENSTGAFSDDEALQKWLNSPPHAATLRKDYRYSCVAVSPTFTVQIFSNL